jgi:hypothetical protein
VVNQRTRERADVHALFAEPADAVRDAEDPRIGVGEVGILVVMPPHVAGGDVHPQETNTHPRGRVVEFPGTVTIIQRRRQRVVVIFSGRWKDVGTAAMAELIKDGTC